jgi:hypothetical protein
MDITENPDATEEDKAAAAAKGGDAKGGDAKAADAKAADAKKAKRLVAAELDDA